MNRRWRKRILILSFLTLLCLIGSWFYGVYITDIAFRDDCTQEVGCIKKDTDDEKFVENIIQDFVSAGQSQSFYEGVDDEHPIPQKAAIDSLLTHKTQVEVKAKKTSFFIPDVPKILWWDFYSGGKHVKNDTITCKGGTQCHVVSERSYNDHPDTMAIMHYGTHFNFMDLPKERIPSILWGLIHEESMKNADFLFNHEAILSLFNYTATFKRQSDYPVTTQFLPNIEYLQSKKYLVPINDKNRYRKEDHLAPIFYIQSDCQTPSNREKYVELLQKYINVDSYGKCNNNKKLPDYLSFEKSMGPMNHEEFFKLGAKYKFTLSMENAVCDDYITEKVWRPFHLGSIPIIFGSPKIKDFLPSKKSAILVNDFDDVKDLAAFVRYLDGNDTAYEEYLHYKERYGITNTYLVSELDKRQWSKYDNMKRSYWSFFSGFECYICERLHDNIMSYKSGKQIKTKVATLEQYGCPPPKLFNDKGQYVVNDPRYSFHWYEGKYRAQAFRYFYDRNLNFTEKSIHELAQSLRKEYSENR